MKTLRKEKYKEQLLQYQAALDTIERHKGKEFSYETARELMEQGKAVESGKWRMQLDDGGDLWLGQLTSALDYHWGVPLYIPPVLLLLKWQEVERSKI